MPVYIGQVSSKNGLGKLRNVVATDDVDFARGFGITGKLGDVYSNRKIGMLKLDGETKHSEVAIDPSEMNRVELLDYARSHTSSIVDYGSIANALMKSNRTELQSIARSIDNQCQVDSLSNEARGEIVKVALGVGNVETAKQMIGQDDNVQALIDTIKRTAVQVYYIQTAEVGGVEFSIEARGTTSVKINPSSKVINVRLVGSGHVSGSVSSATTKYKDNFKAIKQEVISSAENIDVDRQMKYDPLEDVVSTASNIQSLLSQTARTNVRRAVTQIEKKFEDVEPFNPASVKSKIWRELSLSTTDIPNSGLSEESLRAYANNEITALQFAMLPENKMAEKITKFINKLLSKASVDSLSERVKDRIGNAQVPIEEIKRSVEQSIEKVTEKVDGLSDFNELYHLYSQPNLYWENEIIQNCVEELRVEDKSKENKSSLDTLIHETLFSLVNDEATTQYNIFKNNFEIEDGSSVEQSEVIKEVTNKLSEQSNNIFQETDIINMENYRYVTEQYFAMKILPKVYDEIVSTFDFDRGLAEARELLVSLLSSKKPFSDIERAIWVEKVNGLMRMKDVLYFAKEDRLQEFSDIYAEDLKIKKDGNESEEGYMDREVIKKIYSEELRGDIERAYTSWIESEYNIPEIESSQEKLIDVVLEQQLDMGVDDFISETDTEDLSEDNLRDAVQEYLIDNYEQDFYVLQLERVMNNREVKDILEVKMLDILVYDETYNNIDNDYWNRKLEIVSSNKELCDYVRDANVEGFVSRYCSDIEDYMMEEI